MKEKIKRIRKMEQLMDRASGAVMEFSAAFDKYVEAQEAMATLSDYYDSEAWLQDFADDEAGRLPADLKRGVLSEDGLWNLLSDNRHLLQAMADFLQSAGDGKLKKVLMIAVIFLLPLGTLAQQTKEKQRSRFEEKMLKFKAFGDSMLVRGLDRSYIEQPVQGFSVEARTTFYQASLKMDNQWTQDGIDATLSVRMDNGFNTAVGFWAGYRGFGFGLSKLVSGGNGSSFSIGLAGGNYAANLRINKYETNFPELTLKGTVEDEPIDEHLRGELDELIRVRSIYLDAYYFFNGKKYSYLAAADQSLIQRRSAGSLAVGAMYYHSKIDYSEDLLMYVLMQGVGKQKTTQASIGVGYGYNWVPGRGWLVSAMAMPMLTFYNRTELFYYGMEYAGSKTTEEEVLSDDKNYKTFDMGSEKTHNHLIPNFNARLSVVYNWPRVYARLFGHYNHFYYGSHDTTGHLSEWTIYTSVGFRF